MQQQATGTAIPAVASNKEHCRKVWILTGYGISFLAMCGVLAYYFSAYITH
ncbi:MAG TPA: hypothetical protein VFK81_05170 [Terriglobales bacterium]|jgi:hypothetical protein|nr:hypothetical protein [Terriglobales bacterium]